MTVYNKDDSDVNTVSIVIGLPKHAVTDIGLVYVEHLQGGGNLATSTGLLERASNFPRMHLTAGANAPKDTISS